MVTPPFFVNKYNDEVLQAPYDTLHRCIVCVQVNVLRDLRLAEIGQKG